MEGNEVPFTKHLTDAVRRVAADASRLGFNYCEIGVAHGETMAAACQVMSEVASSGVPMAIGYDLGIEVCFDQSAIEANLKPFKQWAKFYKGSGRVELAKAGLQFDFIFIDACHGAPCVRADFIAAAARLRQGGVIAFHDASVACQGQHHQPHCNTAIDVRQATVSLGLLPQGNLFRHLQGPYPIACKGLPGWEVLEDVEVQHGCLFVRKGWE